MGDGKITRPVPFPDKFLLRERVGGRHRLGLVQVLPGKTYGERTGRLDLAHERYIERGPFRGPVRHLHQPLRPA